MENCILIKLQKYSPVTAKAPLAKGEKKNYHSKEPKTCMAKLYDWYLSSATQ